MTCTHSHLLLDPECAFASSESLHPPLPTATLSPHSRRVSSLKTRSRSTFFFSWFVLSFLSSFFLSLLASSSSSWMEANRPSSSSSSPSSFVFALDDGGVWKSESPSESKGPRGAEGRGWGSRLVEKSLEKSSGVKREMLLLLESSDSCQWS